MTSMLRSDPMSICDIYLQPEAAFEILSRIGDMNCVQFLDMTPDGKAFQRNYISDVCRCAEMERKLRYMESEMIKDNIYIPEAASDYNALQPNEMLMLENLLEKWEDDILEMAANQTKLMKNYLEMTEMSYVLHHIGPILGDAEIRKDSIFSRQGDLGTTGRLIVMTGVVRRSKSYHFEMMLWRVSRGNIYYRQASEDAILEDPYTRQDIRKVAFLAVCQGEQLNYRLEKVCNGFRADVYPCPKTFSEREEMLASLDLRLNDLEHVLKKTKYHRCKALRTVGRQWHQWMIQVKKAKAIYHTMNLFTLDITKKCLIGQCWIPDYDLSRVQHTLEYCSEVIGTNVPSFLSKTETLVEPPTYIRTNKFTAGFQALINAYGFGAYRELNPGLYTIISFPFLFAVMFGDMGHGIIVVVFSSWMIINEKKFMKKKSGNQIWNIFFGGRYVILFMGIFTLFTGFIYNEIFAIPLRLYPSQWKNKFSVEELAEKEFLTVEPRKDIAAPYIFGVDPLWSKASNGILYENSLKMKMSIIIGVIHMMFGLWLTLFNHIFFKHYYAIILEFIPQVLFLACLFMWLVILIFMKWWTYSARAPTVKKQIGCAPLLLIIFIDMVLMSKTKAIGDECDAYMFPNQRTLQTSFVVIALICVPILFLGTPIYKYRYNKKRKLEALKKVSNFRSYQHRDSDKKIQEMTLAEVAKYSISFGELMIHQAVHTIEFVLSSISHTASYLRLWALSLAHSQLSDMLWEMVLSKMAIQDFTLVGVPKLFVVFAVWAVFSLSILVLMEGLSAFLHTLRLHWVEFMSKFFEGNGYRFYPFSFDALLYGDVEEDKGMTICSKFQPKPSNYA